MQHRRLFLKLIEKKRNEQNPICTKILSTNSVKSENVYNIERTPNTKNRYN